MEGSSEGTVVKPPGEPQRSKTGYCGKPVVISGCRSRVARSGLLDGGWYPMAVWELAMILRHFQVQLAFARVGQAGGQQNRQQPILPSPFPTSLEVMWQTIPLLLKGVGRKV